MNHRLKQNLPQRRTKALKGTYFVRREPQVRLRLCGELISVTLDKRRHEYAAKGDLI
jgi:hypothetical protein